ncbi:hypothetical protein ACOMHN_024817 [Nucella lapillus]
MPFQGIDRASVAQANGSGTEDTKVGSWWLNRVAKRSTIGGSTCSIPDPEIDEGQADCLHLQGIDVPVSMVRIPKTMCMKGAHVSLPSAVGCVRVKRQILQ